ncbi:hypothetical protein ACHAWO_008943 [Cyclotella atomus]|uniref:Uncharacterized protein n=1 Tax=Cyclotella atomus TaxID=382360 RepID=A0ABD3QHI0_9STRA
MSDKYNSSFIYVPTSLENMLKGRELAEYHTFCLNPPIKKLPDAETPWECPACIEDEKKRRLLKRGRIANAKKRKGRDKRAKEEESELLLQKKKTCLEMNHQGREDPQGWKRSIPRAQSLPHTQLPYDYDDTNVERSRSGRKIHRTIFHDETALGRRSKKKAAAAKSGAGVTKSGPRRKPGARECMQMSRRFGSNVIDEKYYEILMDYSKREARAVVKDKGEIVPQEKHTALVDMVLDMLEQSSQHTYSVHAKQRVDVIHEGAGHETRACKETLVETNADAAEAFTDASRDRRARPRDGGDREAPSRDWRRSEVGNKSEGAWGLGPGKYCDEASISQLRGDTSRASVLDMLEQSSPAYLLMQYEGIFCGANANDYLEQHTLVR